MAETLVTRVRNRVGTYTNATQLVEWLELGARMVYTSLPKIKKDKFSTPTLITSAGLDATRYIVTSFRYNGPGRFVTIEMKYFVSNGSIHAGSTYSPVGWFENTKFYTYPSTGCYALVLAIPTLTSASTSITNFPAEFEEAPIIYASIQAIESKIATLLDTTIGGLAWQDVGAPSAPSAPSFTYTPAVIEIMEDAEVSFTDLVAYTPVPTSIDYTSINAALSDEDEELVSANAQALQAHLEEIQKELLNQLNEFNSQVENTKNSLTKAIQNAQLVLQKTIAYASKVTDANLANEAQAFAAQVQEYQATLTKYQVDTSAYAAQINGEASRIGTSLQRSVAQLQGMINTHKLLQEEYARLIEEVKRGG